MTTLLNGLLGGLAAGVVAAVLTRAVFRGSSPSVGVFAGVTGDERSRPWLWAAAVQVAYGGLSGVGFLALELGMFNLLGVPPSATDAFGVALAWGALLFVVAFVGAAVVASGMPDRRRVRILFVHHLAFGLGLGLWIRLTWIT